MLKIKTGKHKETIRKIFTLILENKKLTIEKTKKQKNKIKNIVE